MQNRFSRNPSRRSPRPGRGFGYGARRGGVAVRVRRRYGVSNGAYRKDLGDPFARGQLNSRLIYSGTTTHGPEVFGRIDAPFGLFVKGYAGIGWQNGGTLRDEDFPPEEVPYSRTDSRMRGGLLDYAAFDLGYRLVERDGYRIGAYIGYQRYFEKFHGYGCEQTGGGNICAGSPYGPDMRVLSETGRWDALRIGLTGDVRLSERLSLGVDLTYMPFARLSAFDNHWMRPELGPMAENGRGFGLQAEAILSYRLTQAWSVGAGARITYFKTDTADTRFPGMPPSPLHFSTYRWGAFVQASYAFGAAGSR